MYNTGTISDLTFTDKSQIEEFFKSSFDEIGYFNCNIGNLVSLREYLIELKKKKSEYDKLIAEPLKSIQEKNPWCTDIQPANEDIFIMKVQTKNYPSIYIFDDNDELGANAIVMSHNPILNNMYLKRYDERTEIIDNSVEELKEIENIIRSFGFNNANEGLITISNRFLVVPYSFEEVHVKKKRLGYYQAIRLDDNGNFISDSCGLTCFNRKDTKKYANSLVRKLYLTKK